MNKNNIIGLILIAAIFIGFQLYMKPSAEEIAIIKAEQKRVKDSLSQIKIEEKALIAETTTNLTVIKDSSSLISDSIETAAINQELINKYGIFAPSALGEDKDFILENNLIRLVLSSKSGRISSAYLKKYKKYIHNDSNKENWPIVQLFDKDSSDLNFAFNVNGKNINTKDLYFSSYGEDVSVTDETSNFIFKLKSSNDNKYIEFIYTLQPNSYMVDFDVKFKGFENDIVSNQVTIDWNANMFTNEKSKIDEERVSTVFYKYEDEERDYLSEQGDDEETFEKDIDWIAYKTRFFSAILIPTQAFEAKNDASISVKKQSKSSKFLKTYHAELAVNKNEVKNGNIGLQMFFGPNDYDLLETYNIGLERIVNMGWGIIGYVNIYVVKPIFSFFTNASVNIGLAILLLTIIIKTLIFPLYYKNYKSSAKMRVLKPEIEALNKKFSKKDDAMKKQQAQMALYKETGVNPLAGCIPMLIQMPILFAMFRFFPTALQLRQVPFLWADDLAGYDSILNLSFDIPLYGDHVSLFTLLLAVSSIFYTQMSSGNMPQQEGMPNMKVMMYIFPFMMIFFFNNYSSGLSYYYLISNLFTMSQMLIVKKWFINEDAIRAKIEVNKTKPKKVSKFQQRLNEMQKQQQQLKKK